MQTKSQVSLKSYNTFGLDAIAKKLVILESADDVEKCFDRYPDGLVIGGGSNILLTRSYYDVVILNRIKGIVVTAERADEVIIAAGSGENWHQLVLWTLKQNYGGLENLSLIPGTTGAAPIQNIGAYGVELKDVLVGVEYFRYSDQSHLNIPAEECEFGYRDSIFKNEWKDKGFISRIILRLTTHDHNIDTRYQALQQYIAEQRWKDPTIHQVSEAVIAIRQSKLPDWRDIGNAGSFFKNPVVTKSLHKKLSGNYPNVPSFPVDESNVKIPAAWLIQEAGFKGKTIGQVGTYQYQPLVLVNYGGGTADDLLRLKDEIQTAVESKFGIALTPEVTML